MGEVDDEEEEQKAAHFATVMLAERKVVPERVRMPVASV